MIVDDGVDDDVIGRGGCEVDRSGGKAEGGRAWDRMICWMQDFLATNGKRETVAIGCRLRL